MRDVNGKPYLECMCGNIISGRIDSSRDFFTEYGSFWSNNTTQLLAETSDAERRTQTRNRCNGEGYESVALIPLKAGDEIVGLLQFNDKRTNMFSKDLIEYFEDLGISLAIAFKRIESENALRQSQEKYQSLVENIVIGVSLLDPDMKILAMNRQMKQWFNDADLSEKPVCYSVFNNPPKDAPCECCPVARTLKDGLVHESVTEMQTNTGMKHFRLLSSPVKDVAGNVVSVIEMVEDISEHAKAEKEKSQLMELLQQSQKMEAIGTLAGGIAHDFNNILSSVIGYTELALDDMEKGSMTAENLNEVLIAGNRAKELVGQILDFSRQSETAKQPIQIKLIAKEVLKMLKASFPSTIEIRQQLDSGAFVFADPTQIHQVIMNLCTNAGHAMRNYGGRMEVTLADMSIDAETFGKFSTLAPGPYVRLTLSDTGHGISESIINRIFDPFFTTKPKGEGTGMGLSVVHGIVKSHGGDITVRSAPGKGTTFDVFFPVLTKQVTATDVEHNEPLKGGTEHILLIDDEPSIVKMEKRILENLGYRITSTNSSVEALAIFSSDPERFDLVISDLTMPQMTGDVLATHLKHIRPDIPVILCTGLSSPVTDTAIKDIGISALLTKPVLKRQMAHAVREALGWKISADAVD
ncbi:MAG: response regulator [Desulfobacteraceae bacterium]|nr:MAG: response regulator [Desulfobacteraceae bacterium]